jgi:hypothetical protein
LLFFSCSLKVILVATLKRLPIAATNPSDSLVVNTTQPRKAQFWSHTQVLQMMAVSACVAGRNLPREQTRKAFPKLLS